MLKEDMERDAVNKNYMDLVWAVIRQACLDYPGPGHTDFARNSAKDFLLDPNNPWLDWAKVDGKALLNQMDRNYREYGKTLLKDNEFDEIKEYGRILTPEERRDNIS